MDQISDQNNRLLFIDEAHYYVPTVSFRNYIYDYAGGTTTVYFSSTVIRDGVIYATAVHNDTAINLLKRLLNDHAWWPSSAPLCRTATRQR